MKTREIVFLVLLVYIQGIAIGITLYSRLIKPPIPPVVITNNDDWNKVKEEFHIK